MFLRAIEICPTCHRFAILYVQPGLISSGKYNFFCFLMSPRISKYDANLFHTSLVYTNIYFASFCIFPAFRAIFLIYSFK